jgi:glucosamine-6-phosphate deaminase
VTSPLPLPLINRSDAAVPISLLADHPNVQFNFYRHGIGSTSAEMH